MSDSEIKSPHPNYTVLAPLYDRIMQDVDYESWAEYIDDLIQIHAPSTEAILELACGTGSIAILLDEFGYYRITATDVSKEMIEVASSKAAAKRSDVEFRAMDMLEIDLDHRFDLVLMVFDSINYLHTKNRLMKLFSGIERILKPGGFFIFDFATPRNSRKAIHFLNNEQGRLGNYRYHQTSLYDGKEKMHTNEFRIEELTGDGKTILNISREVHRQRVFDLQEMTGILGESRLSLTAAYDDFSFRPADRKSLRITMITRCPKTA